MPPVPLVYPRPAGLFFLGVFADEKKTSGSACIDASRLIFQSPVSFQIRLVAKKQDPLVFLHPSGKTQRIHRTHPKRAFDEFKIRWVPPVPLVYPQPAGLFFLGVFADEKKTADPLASMLAD